MSGHTLCGIAAIGGWGAWCVAGMFFLRKVVGQ